MAKLTEAGIALRLQKFMVVLVNDKLTINDVTDAISKAKGVYLETSPKGKIPEVLNAQVGAALATLLLEE